MTILLFIGGLIGLVAGAELLVRGASNPADPPGSADHDWRLAAAAVAWPGRQT